MKRPYTLLLLGSACLVMLGCAEQGPQRYDISGTVTYKGQPIPAGTVQFVPDSAQGNRGPSGQATIVDGKYDTSTNGLGVVGGPHIVNIQAFDGKALPDLDLPNGKPIFYSYEERVELPKEESLTRDIDVPPQREVNRSSRSSRGEPFNDDV